MPSGIVTDKVTAMTDESAKAHAFHDEVIPAMDEARAAADKAEEIIDEEYFRLLPCYSRACCSIPSNVRHSPRGSVGADSISARKGLLVDGRI